MAAGTVVKHPRKAGAFTSGQLAEGQVGVNTADDRLEFSTDGVDVIPVEGAAIGEFPFYDSLGAFDPITVLGGGTELPFYEFDGSYDAVPIASSGGGGGGGEAFPVGSIFISIVATDPATLLGYGTWAAFGAGRVLVGLDVGQTEFDTVLETGGAKTHTLTEAEIPAHTHIQNAHEHSPVTDGGTIVNNGAGNAFATVNQAGATGSLSVGPVTATNQNTGGGGAHNNLQPYIVVYMWERTA